RFVPPGEAMVACFWAVAPNHQPYWPLAAAKLEGVTPSSVATVKFACLALLSMDAYVIAPLVVAAVASTSPVAKPSAVGAPSRIEPAEDEQPTFRKKIEAPVRVPDPASR